MSSWEATYDYSKVITVGRNTGVSFAGDSLVLALLDDSVCRPGNKLRGHCEVNAKGELCGRHAWLHLIRLPMPLL